MNAPINIERAFCETSSVTTILKDLGVAVLLADENAESIEATANVDITNMLADIMSRRSPIESFSISGTMSLIPIPSA